MQKDAILKTWIPETNRRKDRLDAKSKEKLRKNQQLRQVYQDKVREVEKERSLALELEEREIGSIKQPRERRREERGHGNSKGTFPKCMSDTDRKQEEASHAHMKCFFIFLFVYPRRLWQVHPIPFVKPQFRRTL